MKRLNFRKIKRQVKGITLIALVVTIIVLLILATVAINLTIGNNGIFKRAQMTTYKTDIGTIKEELELKKMEGFLDKINIITLKIDDLNISDSLKNKFRDKLIIWDILYYNVDAVPDAEERKWLEEMDIYPVTDEVRLSILFLGEDGKGRPVNSITEEEISNQLKEGKLTYLSQFQTGIQEGLPQFNIYAKYKEVVYRIKTHPTFKNTSIDMITENVDIVYTPQGKEGEDLSTLTGEDKHSGWIILYDNRDKDGTVEAVSPKALGSLTLGYLDEEAISAENKNIDRAIYSYNNAVDRLNQYCEEQVSDEIRNDSKVKGIRSIGGPKEDTSDYYQLEGIYNKRGKVGDNNYEQDLIRMSYFINDTDSSNVWMASRMISQYGDNGNIIFGIRWYGYNAQTKVSSGSVETLWDTSGNANNCSYKVRPVIKVEI